MPSPAKVLRAKLFAVGLPSDEDWVGLEAGERVLMLSHVATLRRDEDGYRADQRRDR